MEKTENAENFIFEEIFTQRKELFSFEFCFLRYYITRKKIALYPFLEKCDALTYHLFVFT
ncbi:hypothetical protein [Candidatus Scalindua japonica]|uniref:hypothetical protein n=1 Tax=Candidatus Scalindua japonica TaxID=1284222 RepID=UPI000BDE670B|nr:hypothetical protein [Candidatus Scalindua japonica]